MSFYSSLIFTPSDRRWTASSDFVSSFALAVGVQAFDHFAVYSSPVPVDELEDESDSSEILSEAGVSVSRAVLLHRADESHWTHYLLPSVPSFAAIHEAASKQISPDTSAGFAPWDCGMSVGYWTSTSYDEGIITDRGRTAIRLSANGYPASLSDYVAAFRQIDAVQAFRSQLESLSSQSWEITIQMT